MQIDQIILLILAISWLSKKSISIESKGLKYFTRGQIACPTGVSFWGVLSLFSHF